MYISKLIDTPMVLWIVIFFQLKFGSLVSILASKKMVDWFIRFWLRPDITFVVGVLNQYRQKSYELYWTTTCCLAVS